jgi:DNA-directed RNA polymerase subunit RPC12/RpoP
MEPIACLSCGQPVPSDTQGPVFLCPRCRSKLLGGSRRVT